MKSKVIFHLTASGFYTAICLASLSISTDIVLLKSKPNWIYFYFLFFVTFLFYNFQKITWYGHPRMFVKENIKYLWPARYPGLLLLSLIIGFTGTLALISYSVNSPLKITLGLMAGLIALLYNQKIFGIRLRSKKGFKAFTIASVSIIAGVLIPAAQYIVIPPNFLTLMIYTSAQFFFISAMCIAADIRDIEEDKEDHIKTFPVEIGLPFSKKFVALLMLFQITLVFILFKLTSINMHQLEIFILISLLSIIFVFQLNLKKSYFYYVIGIDGLILCQTICMIISKSK